MVYLKRYWQAIREVIMHDEGKAKLIEERERLLEVCVPYKIQSCDSGYLERPNVIKGLKKLIELDRKLEEELLK